MLSGYAFGNLVLSMPCLSIPTNTARMLTRSVDENPDPGFSVDQAQTLGRIQVTVERVKLKETFTTTLDTKPITTVNEAPEKALKGRPIDTTVR